MAEASTASRAAPESGSQCPGCAKGIDPLRAGHVAIYDGVFLYYCNATCKALHLRTIASHLGDDVPTLDPPAVAARVQATLATAVARPASSEANGRFPLPGAFPPPSPDAPFRSAPPVSHERARDSEPRANEALDGSDALDEETDDPFADDAVEPEARVDESPSSDQRIPLPDPEPPPPQTMRSPAVSRADIALAPSLASSSRTSVPSPAKAATSSAMSTRGAVSIAGGVAGVFVPLLAIADVALVVRAALALFATTMLLVRAAMAKRDPSAVDPLLASVPVVLATGAGILCVTSGDPRAAAVLVLGGLSASVALGVEEAIERAWRDVDVARAKIDTALAVSSRVVRGPAIVDADDVKAGEEVVIEAGDVVGVDGVLRAGEVVIVPWDGATAETTKGEGDAVVAGARVVSGRARVVTAWAGGDRAWARATASRVARPDIAAPAARLARGLALQGIPLAAIVAGGAACLSGMASGWIGAIAVACAVGVGLAGRGLVSAIALIHARAQMKTLAHGVVYRDARAFDAAGRAAIAVVCSRGTVLTGIPEIVAVEGIAGSESSRNPSDSNILALAAGAETGSTHPFASAILRAARTRGVRMENVRSATVHPGLGVTALSSSGDRLVVGSRALLLQEKVSVAVVEARASELEAQGRSVLLVALAGKLVGLIALQDGLRAGARAAVQRLLDARIEPVLLSGESRETCETIARALDIDHVRPEVLPVERGAEVRALAEGGQLVAVIGHPSSDDGALGAADLAIAMGAAGRAAGEWGVSLASDDVRDAALALSIAHAARDKSRAVFALGLAPGVATLLAMVFAVGPLVCGPLAMGVAVAVAMTLARRD